MIKSIIPEGLAKFFRTKVNDNGVAEAVKADAPANGVMQETAAVEAPVETKAPERKAINSYVDLGGAIITVTGMSEETHGVATKIAAVFQDHLASVPDTSALHNMNVYFTAIPDPDQPEDKMNLRGLAIGRTGEAFDVVNKAISALSQNPEHAPLFQKITLLFGSAELKPDVIAAARPQASSGSAAEPPSYTAEA